MNTINLNISVAFRNKQLINPYTQSAYGNSFYPKSVTIDKLINHVQAGLAFTMGCFEGNNRSRDTFVSSQLVGLDFDENISVEDCLSHDFVSEYASFVYPTPSSTPQSPKSRVIFLLDETITDSNIWERLQRGLMWHFSDLQPDEKCKDSARLFFGSTVKGFIEVGKVLPIKVLSKIADEMENELGKIERRTLEENEAIRERNRAIVANDKQKQAHRNYALKAVDNMVTALSHLSEGSRNDTLNKYAWKVGTFIGAGMITSSDCEGLLYNAARTCGLSDREIKATLYRAIRDGQTTPFDLSELERKWQDRQKQRESHQQVAHEITKNYYQQKQKILASRNPTQILIDYVRDLKANYLNGDYVSFYGTNPIPLSIISAMLCLTDTRSNSALVMGKMHVALLSGKLSPVFTVHDVIQATKFNRRTVETCLSDLSEFLFLHVLDTNIINESLFPISAKKGRQAQYYCVADIKTMLNHIPLRLFKSLSIYFTEKIHRESLSEFTYDLSTQLGIDDSETISAIRSLNKAAIQSDKLTKESRYKLRSELEGSETWKGWENALNSPFSLPIDWDKCKSIRDVRGQILRQWVSKVRSINSQDDLCRVLGCSTSTLATLYGDYDVISEDRWHNEEFIVLNVKNVKPIIQNLQKIHKGVVWAIRFKRRYTNGWESIYPDYAPIHFLKTRKGIKDSAEQEFPIEKMFVQMRLHSEQHIMTDKEIKEREIERQKALEKTVQETTPDKQNKPKSERKPRNYTKPSREWRKHDIGHLYRQVQLYVSMFADAYLKDNCILNKKGDVLVQSNDLGEIMRWVAKNGKLKKGKPLRSSAVVMQNETAILQEEYDLELKNLFKQGYDDEMKILRQETEYAELREKVEKVDVPF